VTTLGRRDLLGAAAAFALSAACKSDDDSGEQPTRTQALVVGTGFGGSVAALRLGLAGVETIVLERGRRWPTTEAGDTFCEFEKPDRRSSWLSDHTNFPYAPPASFDPYVGVIEKIEGSEIDVVVGAGVGGGSLVYGATMVQPTAELFAKVFPPEVAYDELANVFYPRVRDLLSLSSIPDDILASEPYTSSRIFLEAASKTALRVEKNLAAVSWDRVRDELAGRAPASLVKGQLVYGVNSGAKSSLDKNYLAEAERTGKVRIETLHVVKAIASAGADGFRVECDVIDEEGNVVRKRVFLAQKLFLGAGSMGTTKLLVKAKAKGGLPALDDAIGRGWGNNGDYLVGRQLQIPTRAILGAPPAIVVHRHDDPRGAITIEHGTGATGIECNCQPILGMGIPDANGTFSYDASTDDVTLTWSRSDMRNIPELVKDLVAEINRAGGGTILDIGTLARFHTYHPLGGAVMGKACDLDGRVKGYRGLYVVDGALLPGSAACANPSYTIAAIAERCMDRVLRADF
jgi:cholesterol oxidase